MDQAVYIPANPDIPAQPEMLPEHVCHLDNGVEAPSSALVIKHVVYDLYILQLYLVLTILVVFCTIITIITTQCD